MNGLTLYEINAEINRLVNEAIDPETGEIQEIAGLDELEMGRVEKVKNIVNLYNYWGAMIEAGRAEMGRLSANVSRLENNRARLKAYVEGNVDPGEKISDPETGRALVGWRKSKSLEISDEEAAAEYCVSHLPDAVEYKQVLKKTEIKKAMENGVGIPGCRIIENNNIQIK